MTILHAIFARREMLGSLVTRDLKGRYKGSVLGFLWSVLTPLFMAAVYVFFLRLLARGVPIEEIIIGVFAWQFTVTSVNSGMDCITGNTNLVKKVAFPRVILPIASTLANLVNYLLSLIVQFALVAIIVGRHGEAMSIWSFAVPLLILHHTLFNLALAMLVGSANVYFRDTHHLVGVLLSAWFFVSPVMYSMGLLQQFAGSRAWLLDAYMLNPLAVIITGYRAMILENIGFTATPYALAGLLWPLALLVVAYLVFKRAQRNFADML